MSAQGNSFLYWLVSRTSSGAVPVDGMLWLDAQAARNRRERAATQRVASPVPVQLADCEDCPSPIF
jgi:hypothetical protein